MLKYDFKRLNRKKLLKTLNLKKIIKLIAQ